MTTLRDHRGGPTCCARGSLWSTMFSALQYRAAAFACDYLRYALHTPPPHPAPHTFPIAPTRTHACTLAQARANGTCTHVRSQHHS